LGKGEEEPTMESKMMMMMQESRISREIGAATVTPVTLGAPAAPEAKEVTLKELARRMAAFAAAREWDQFHSPRNLLLALVGEVGELSEIFQWKGEVLRGLGDWNDADKEHLGEELADVLLYLVRLADVCNVNLGDSTLRKLQKNATKYPVELCKGNSTKYYELARNTVRRNLNNTENRVYESN
jgi:dCTP diphosphatase